MSFATDMLTADYQLEKMCDGIRNLIAIRDHIAKHGVTEPLKDLVGAQLEALALPMDGYTDKDKEAPQKGIMAKIGEGLKKAYKFVAGILKKIGSRIAEFFKKWIAPIFVRIADYLKIIALGKPTDATLRTWIIPNCKYTHSDADAMVQLCKSWFESNKAFSQGTVLTFHNLFFDKNIDAAKAQDQIDSDITNYGRLVDMNKAETAAIADKIPEGRQVTCFDWKGFNGRAWDTIFRAMDRDAQHLTNVNEKMSNLINHELGDTVEQELIDLYSDGLKLLRVYNSSLIGSMEGVVIVTKIAVQYMKSYVENARKTFGANNVHEQRA